MGCLNILLLIDRTEMTWYIVHDRALKKDRAHDESKMSTLISTLEKLDS